MILIILDNYIIVNELAIFNISRRGSNTYYVIKIRDPYPVDFSSIVKKPALYGAMNTMSLTETMS